MSKLRPHNKPFQLTALGHHVFCMRKSRAGSLRPVMTGLRPRLQLNGALSGRSAPRRTEEKFRNEILGNSNCARDEGRPLGFGLQDQNPNHQLLLSLNGLGSEQVWKRRGLPVRCLLERRTNLNRCRGVERIGTSSKPRRVVTSGSSLGETCPLPRWCPAWRWRELGSGSGAKRGNLSPRT